jgi:hypothetical protein
MTTAGPVSAPKSPPAPALPSNLQLMSFALSPSALSVPKLTVAPGTPACAGGAACATCAGRVAASGVGALGATSLGALALGAGTLAVGSLVAAALDSLGLGTESLGSSDPGAEPQAESSAHAHGATAERRRTMARAAREDMLHGYRMRDVFASRAKRLRAVSGADSDRARGASEQGVEATDEVG